MINIIIGQDGGFVEDEALNFPFNPGDIKYSKKYKKNIYDFVGFIINDKNMLAVFPKHYNDDCIISTEEEKKENVSLLFKVIKKYITEEYNNQNGDKYFGYENNYESDYPFSSFFKVYNYYKKYGIYKEEKLDSLIRKQVDFAYDYDTYNFKDAYESYEDAYFEAYDFLGKEQGVTNFIKTNKAMMDNIEEDIDNPEMKKLFDRGLALNEELRSYRKEMFRNLENDEIEM